LPLAAIYIDAITAGNSNSTPTFCYAVRREPERLSQASPSSGLNALPDKKEGKKNLSPIFDCAIHTTDFKPILTIVNFQLLITTSAFE